MPHSIGLFQIICFLKQTAGRFFCPDGQSEGRRTVPLSSTGNQKGVAVLSCGKMNGNGCWPGGSARCPLPFALSGTITTSSDGSPWLPPPMTAPPPYGRSSTSPMIPMASAIPGSHSLSFLPSYASAFCYKERAGSIRSRLFPYSHSITLRMVSSSRLRSTGFARWAFMPLSLERRLSSSKALADTAMMGSPAFWGSGRARMARAAW